MTSPVAESKLNVAQLDWRTLIKFKGQVDEKIVVALNQYFEPFAQVPGEIGADGNFNVEDGHPCLKCGEPLTGLLSALTGGGFTWGLVHGEGNCRNCGWPARAYHYIKDLDGNKLMTIQPFVIQYHPDFVTPQSAKKEPSDG